MVKSYLDKRFQTVKFIDQMFTKRQVIHGVPQGSKLGSLLFILYINDLPGVIKYCKIHMFADDDDQGNDLQDDINKVNEEFL